MEQKCPVFLLENEENNIKVKICKFQENETMCVDETEFADIDMSFEKLFSGDILKKYRETEAEIYFYLLTSSESTLNVLTRIVHCSNINLHNVRIVLDNPYGRNYEEAGKVNRILSEFFEEEQIFRIDHCLGNTGIDRLFKLKNEESLKGRWNKNYIQEFCFIFLEKETGKPEEILQSYILQLMIACITNEPDMEDQGEKMNAYETILDSFENCRNSFRNKSYRELENGMLIHGQVSILSGRWRGVPFNLMAGKGIPEKRAEVHIKFKDLEKPVIISFNEEDKQKAIKYAEILEYCFSGERQRFLGAEEINFSWEFRDSIERLLDKKIR